MTAFNMYQPTLAAIAVVIQGDKVLLVRRKAEPDAGLWGFPGGHVEWGEQVTEAACRELKEETGVEAMPEGVLTGLDIIVHSEAGTVEHHFYLVAVKCRYLGGDAQGRDDVYEAAWFAQQAVLDRCMPLSEQVDEVLSLAQAYEAQQSES